MIEVDALDLWHDRVTARLRRVLDVMDVSLRAGTQASQSHALPAFYEAAAYRRALRVTAAARTSGEAITLLRRELDEPDTGYPLWSALLAVYKMMPGWIPVRNHRAAPHNGPGRPPMTTKRPGRE